MFVARLRASGPESQRKQVRIGRIKSQVLDPKRRVKEHRPILYTDLIVTENLFPHLEEIDTACRERLEIIEKAMMQQEGVTEALKAADQMEWVRSMNSIQNRAEEIVLAELVYCLSLIHISYQS